jgi:putative flavoprotein involved in K+ transport
LERGRIAERWRSERWDSLRLLTPNWMTRLPGYEYAGPDEDGFMTASEVVSFFAGYASSFEAPVLEHTNVTRVARGPGGSGFVVQTDAGELRSRNVVVASGWCDVPAVPSLARDVSPRVRQVVPTGYRRPDDLDDGGVLVVGASATGVQLAHELHRSGRPVTLAVGSHSRMPRTYRGMDSFWWLELLGSFDRTVDEVDDPAAARHEPSLQLVGSEGRATLDLSTLQQIGVRLVGRLKALDGTRASFAGDVAATTSAADRRMNSALDRIDDAVDRLGLAAEVLAPDRPAAVRATQSPSRLDLRKAGITSIVWATGHRRPYRWLDLPILDRRGEIVQYRGVTPLPGAYVLGQRFQHFRNSNFIDGVGRDAMYVAEHICRTHVGHDWLAATSTPLPK